MPSWDNQPKPSASPIALVLHGGSGIPAPDLLRVIKNGICKINLATEIKNIFIRTLHTCFEAKDEIDLRKIFPPAIAAVKTLVTEKLNIVC